MKILRKLLITVILGSIVCCLFINNCSNFYVEDDYLTNQKTILEAFDYIEQGDVVLIDSSLNETFAEIDKEYYLMIPEKYRDLLVRDGWKVYFKDCLYLAEQDYTKKLGITCPQGKIIVVAGQNIGNMQGILYHEIGHAIDNIYRIITPTNEAWYDIYMDCKDNYIVNSENNNFKEYIKSSRAEFFAGMFIEYLLHPDYLQEFGPDIYNFINFRLSLPMFTATELNILIDCICLYIIVGIVVELIDIIKPTKKKIDTV